MRKIKEILRLSYELKLSHRQISRSLGVGLGTVAQYLKRAAQTGLEWPLAQELQEDEAALERKLYPRSRPKRTTAAEAPLDYGRMYAELQRKGVTKYLLWEEYKQAHPQGYGYSQYCLLYRKWLTKQKRSMRQSYKAGEKLYVDYSGTTVPIHNAHSGQIRQAQIFIAVMGASQYAYAEAFWSQSQADWIQAHVNTFKAMGGVAQIVVPDNLKSAVIKADRYEPTLNTAYEHMAAHYGIAIIPARPYKPKDKAKVENAVQLVQRWILARLRHHTFFSLNELNTAIAELLISLNQRPFKQRPGHRKSLFEALDKPALRPLPLTAYIYTEFKIARVPPDYHVTFDQHHYSVPHHLVGHRVDIHATASSVSCFYHGKQMALHVRRHQAGEASTHPDHMPKAHRYYQDQTLEELNAGVCRIGIHAAQLTTHFSHARYDRRQIYRSLEGLLKLARQYGDSRFENACARAIRIGAPTCRSVRSILKHGLDQLALEHTHPEAPAAEHEHIRGAHYYH